MARRLTEAQERLLRQMQAANAVKLHAVKLHPGWRDEARYLSINGETIPRSGRVFESLVRLQYASHDDFGLCDPYPKDAWVTQAGRKLIAALDEVAS